MPPRIEGANRQRRSFPPETFFLLSACAQYTGAVVAIRLFDEVDPATVALMRVVSAAVLLVVVSLFFRRADRPAWSSRDLASVALFGVATAAMNLFFYLGVNNLSLGKGVTIEFIGPIAVAAARTRSRRNSVALALATCGVAVLGGVELGDQPLGLFFILCASAMWAMYIVLGSRVARTDRGVEGLGYGLVIGALVIAPFSYGDVGNVVSNPRLLMLCIFVGAFSSAIGYGIDQSVLRRIPVRRFSVMLALLPVTAAVFGAVFLDQAPTIPDLFGMALVLVGVAIQERDTIDRHHELVETT